MFRFFSTITSDLHPALVHFPIALLFLCLILTLMGRTKNKYQETTWILLLVGALSTIPTSIAGFISHFPYEEFADVSNQIGKHNLLGIVVTVLFNLILFWRWRSRQKGADIYTKALYVGALILGCLILFLLGGSGGSLVFEDGVNVRGINPLLK